MRVYHYLEAKWALDDIRRRRLKLSKIDDMNDPYEWRCVCSTDGKTQVALNRTRRDTVEANGVMCFGTCWKNILLWSHYGDKHKGICLGFDVPDKKVRKVEYVRQIEDVGKLPDSDTNECVSDRVRVIDKLFEAKYRRWKYEDEVRVNGSRSEKDPETGFYFVPFSEDLQLRSNSRTSFPAWQGSDRERSTLRREKRGNHHCWHFTDTFRDHRAPLTVIVADLRQRDT